jgi:hypothetical protein
LTVTGVGTVFLAQFTSGVAGAAGVLGLTVGPGGGVPVGGAVLGSVGGAVLGSVGGAVLGSAGGAVLGSVGGALSPDVVPGPPVSRGGAKLRSPCLLPC